MSNSDNHKEVVEASTVDQSRSATATTKTAPSPGPVADEPQDEVHEPEEQSEDIAANEEPDRDRSSSKSSNRRSFWAQAVDELPKVVSTSKGKRVKLLQAALNYRGESYLKLDGIMTDATKGGASRVRSESVSRASSPTYCDQQVWQHLLGDSPPSVSTDTTEFDRGTLLFQSLLALHGYAINPSGYWNEQTDRCLRQFCEQNGLNTNKVTAGVWSSLLVADG